jgi:acyl-coenzyme A synthetase/AMP-(fatty) acid ligase
MVSGAINFFVEDLPRNAAGKILKRELRSRFASHRGPRAPSWLG